VGWAAPRTLTLDVAVGVFLAVSHSNYRELVAAMSSAVVPADGTGRILLWNRGAERLLGRSRRSALGASLPVQLGAGAPLSRLLRTWTAGPDGAPTRVESEITASDGRTIPVEIQVLAPSPGMAGRATTLVLEDLSARREAERRALETSAALEERVAERTSELFAVNQSLLRSRKELQALAARIDAVREEEKGRIARDLHDDLSQLLLVLRLDLKWLEERVSDDSAALARAVSAAEVANQIAASLRRILTELRPEALEQLGLGAVLESEGRLFRERHEIACEVALSADLPAVKGEVAISLYRICQEALTNVVRHAAARRVRVSLRHEPGAVVLEVEDDGRGLGTPAPEPGTRLGLIGMRERAERLGGTLSVGPRLEGGTRVLARIPFPPPPAGAPPATRPGDRSDAG